MLYNIGMKMLIVSSYKEMDELILKLSKEIEDEIIYLPGYKLTKSELVEKINKLNIDIVLARGGNYLYIKEKILVPIVNIEVSIYDLIEDIDLSDVSNSLLIGFSNITKDAKKLAEQTSYKFNILTIDKTEEIVQKIEYIKSFKHIYSDLNTYRFLKENKIDSKIITTSYFSLKEAYLKAKDVLISLKKTLLKEKILDAYLADEKLNVYLYRQNKLFIKRITFDFKIAEIDEFIKKNLKSLLNKKDTEFTIHFENYLVDIYNMFFTLDKEKFVAIKTRYILSKKLKFLPQNNIDNYFVSLKTKKELEKCYLTSFPIEMITSDFEYAKYLLDLMNKNFKLNSEVLIFNGSNLNEEKNLKYLFSNSSPLLSSKRIICILDVDQINFDNLNKILNFIYQGSLYLVNKIVFINLKDSKSLNNSRFPIEKIYLEDFNSSINKKEIIREKLDNYKLKLTNQEINYLEIFNFSQGQTELNKILFELSEIENVSIANIKQICLSYEEKAPIESIDTRNLDMDKVKFKNVIQALRLAKGNKSQAARILKIGRTSLYRILKNNDV